MRKQAKLNVLCIINRLVKFDVIILCLSISAFVLFPLIVLAQENPTHHLPKFNNKDSITVIASTEYKNGQFQKIVYGNRYRKTWLTPVTFPLFDLNTTVGKLKIVKKGGGMSTQSLRLEDETGKEYVLRSVFKSGRRGVPDKFRNTVYEDILQDLRVGGHPYSALPIAPLAEAAGLYHTNPSIYYLPEQEGLGAYKDLAGELYLFEEYPNEGWDLSSFGNTEKIVGFDKLLEKVRESPKHQIDGAWVLKSRLFDLWIGDYDRHDDQWRWAEFPEDSTNLSWWRPIPRDRDQALYDINGVLPWILSRDFIHIQQKPFSGKINNIKEFAANAKHFDRTWLTELEWKDWEASAKELEGKLTDEVIEEAFETWQKPIYDLDAPSLIKRLKKRRNRMVWHARQLYKLVAKYVNVVGTDKRELFEINRKNKKETEVVVYALNKKREKKHITYRRTFYSSETKEIRLYGLDGEDEFRFKGNTSTAIKVRIIGGKDTDELSQIESAKVKGKVVVYDELNGIKIADNAHPHNHLSNNPVTNEYDREEYQYDSYFPSLTFGSTTDDGFFLGGGLTLSRYGFRKKPYGAKHRLFLQFSTQTNALHFNYASDFVGAVGHLSFAPSIRFDRPIIFNYFGLGNNTQILSEDEQFHWIRLKRFIVEPLLKEVWENKYNTTEFGPFFENVIVERRIGRISDAEGFLTDRDRGNKSFVGVKIKHQFNTLDNNTFPSKGIRLKADFTYYRNLNEEQAYARIEANLTNFFHTKVPFPITLGSRIGGALLTDNHYYFFHNNNLGENNSLRGFRNNRYAGTQVVYHNLDLRIPLFYFKNHIAPGEVGLSAGFDYGRVWYPNANAGGWKSGISGGLWWAPYRFTAIHIFYTRTSGSENNPFTLRTGFFF